MRTIVLIGGCLLATGCYSARHRATIGPEVAEGSPTTKTEMETEELGSSGETCNSPFATRLKLVDGVCYKQMCCYYNANDGYLWIYYHKGSGSSTVYCTCDLNKQWEVRCPCVPPVCTPTSPSDSIQILGCNYLP